VVGDRPPPPEIRRNRCLFFFALNPSFFFRRRIRASQILLGIPPPTRARTSLLPSGTQTFSAARVFPFGESFSVGFFLFAGCDLSKTSTMSVSRPWRMGCSRSTLLWRLFSLYCPPLLLRFRYGREANIGHLSSKLTLSLSSSPLFVF